MEAFNPLAETPEIFTLTDSAGYLNLEASKSYSLRGRYIEIYFNNRTQELHIVSENEPGRGRYAIFGNKGNPVQTRQQLLEVGMKNGKYIHIGKGIFRHIDHLLDEDDEESLSTNS